jgi:DNA-binding response OmpR family regulator
MPWGSAPESSDSESAATDSSASLVTDQKRAALVGRPIRTLLVEDDAKTADMMRRVLERSRATPRFEVAVAMKGAAALRLAKSTRFEATLIDLQLPDMLGLNVAAQIGKNDPDVAQLLYTGHDVTLEQLAEARRMGTLGIVTKPIDSKTIAGILRSNVLGFRQAPRVYGGSRVRIFTDVQALVVDGETRVFNNEDALQHRLLVGLAMARGEVVPRTDLLAYVYQLDEEALRRYREQFPDSDRLGQLVYRARTRLGRRNEWRLKTWRAVGYSLDLESDAEE